MEYSISLGTIVTVSLGVLTILGVVFPAGLYVGRLSERVKGVTERVENVEGDIKSIYRELRGLRKQLFEVPQEDE